MTMRPDPTFHASPKLAMEAPPENFAYTLLLSPDFSKPDALAVIDAKAILAKHIIAAAKDGEHDYGRLRDGALLALAQSNL
jgi:hypothetical protein